MSSSSLSSRPSRLFSVGFGLRLATGGSPSSPSSRALFLGAALAAARGFPSSSTLGFLVYLRFCLGASPAVSPGVEGAAGAAGFSFSLKPPILEAVGVGAASPLAGGTGGVATATAAGASLAGAALGFLSLSFIVSTAA